MGQGALLQYDWGPFMKKESECRDTGNMYYDDEGRDYSQRSPTDLESQEELQGVIPP